MEAKSTSVTIKPNQLAKRHTWWGLKSPVLADVGVNKWQSPVESDAFRSFDLRLCPPRVPGAPPVGINCSKGLWHFNEGQGGERRGENMLFSCLPVTLPPLMKRLMCFGGGTMVTVGRCRKDLVMVSEFLWRFHCRSVLLSNVEHMVSPWEANRSHPRREHFYIYRVSESSVLDPEPKVHFVRSHFQQTWTIQRRRMQPWQPGSPLIGLGSQKSQTPHYGNGVFRYLYFDCFCNDFRNLLWVFVHKSFAFSATYTRKTWLLLLCPLR